ncbi:hypothetical protein CEXT_786681 [Caerostris extrusa]|uniref:Uncharacterized protein n=1 Tax=Caerostris extrusa TaxID=172846 RepID=A0AAV4M9S7_CAEEX|nr:hypothetical protein CEXT_786681 [Caerostris extrusa]
MPSISCNLGTKLDYHVAVVSIINYYCLLSRITKTGNKQQDQEITYAVIELFLGLCGLVENPMPSISCNLGTKLDYHVAVVSIINYYCLLSCIFEE